MYTTSFLLLACLRVSLALQCITPTFRNTTIKVNYDHKVMTGCISPETLQFEGEIRNVSAGNQDIVDLNRGAVQNIPSRFSIYFRNNNIEIIREEAFLNLSQIFLINLADNKISWISANSFKDLPSLERVSLDRNEISVISPGAFNNLPKLRVVYLTRNKLASFDQDWFVRTPKLLFLSLAWNRLRRIPKAALINLPSIKHLSFEKNQIDFIDKDAFQGLNNLTIAIFSENKLKSFDFNIRPPSKLTHIGIGFNNITFLSDEMLERIRPRLKLFSVTGNPWQCACFDKLISWGITNNVSVSFKCTQYESVCVYPKTNPGVCIERGVHDFHIGYWKNFGSEDNCVPGDDFRPGW